LLFCDLFIQLRQLGGEVSERIPQDANPVLAGRGDLREPSLDLPHPSRCKFLRRTYTSSGMAVC
jgi:hypothetical protein